MFGKHLIINMNECQYFPDMDEIFALLQQLPGEIGMKMLTAPYVMRGADHLPGITGVVIIETSHITVHTFEDEKFVAFDLYSCKDYNEKKVINKLFAIFKPKKKKIKVIAR
jgi:spermidine synthase